MTRTYARNLRAMIEKSSASLNDTDALTAIELFSEWKPDIWYGKGVRLRFSHKLYRVVQPHTSQSDWTPDITPALYTEVAEPGTIPVWKQPTGVQDAYMTGDKVHYPAENDPVYTSTIDNNVWAPDVYGWELDQ